ncbi:MAG: hypothetical protein WCJ58_06360 [bacterium]
MENLKQENKYVVKLGGSAVSVSEENIFDFNYLKTFKATLEELIAAGNKFFVTVGGGYTMRKFRDLAKAAGLNDDHELHWMGTTTCVFNAEIVRAFCHDIADAGLYKYEDYYSPEKLEIEKGIKVGGGGRPGHSSDVDAILAAEKIGAKSIISLKNIDSIYDHDPKQFPEAKPVSDLTWDQYLDIIGNVTVHMPGGNYPIDPVASRMAKAAGISFYILGSNDLDNFINLIKNGTFKGTLVH